MKSRRFAAIAALVLSAGLAQAQIVITADTIISPGDPSYQNQDIIIQGCTVIINGAQTFSSLTLERGEANEPAVVTHDLKFSQDGVNGMFLTITGDLFIQGPDAKLVASRIDVDAKGFESHEGPGTSPLVSTGGLGGPYPAGGSYGGAGGASSPGENYALSLPGVCYGSYTQPADFGSGSGAVMNPPHAPYGGASGAGAVRLIVGGSATIDGVVTATGGASNAGGSGGSIAIAASHIAGAGVIRANGGDANDPALCGGGGGGRIAVTADSSKFSGQMLARGGHSVRDFNTGGPGSIYQDIADQRTLIFDNASTGAGGSAELTGNVTVDANVILRNNARLNPHRGGPALNLTINGSLSVDATSQLGAVGRSPYPALAGRGGPGTCCGEHGAGGGGHGGIGGTGVNGPFADIFGVPGPVHGNPNAPIAAGGSGGSTLSPPGWRGGGALHLIVSGPIVLDGRLSADGLPQGLNEQVQEGLGGAGAGGSLWIEAPSISGAGRIFARGGNASAGNGAGGGGRIRIVSCSLGIPQSNISVIGGTGTGGGGSGGAGTLVIAGPSTDWNHDGVVNSTDVSDFINDWFADQVAGTTVTDFNGDGVSNSTDVSDFINAWFAQESAC